MAAPGVKSVRDRLLDAAAQVAVAGQWHDARMADLATVAGVSRQTLYNEFGSKDGLVQALALREADRLLQGAVATVADRSVTDPAAAVAAAVGWALAEAAGNPLVKAALVDDAGDLLPMLTTRSGAVVLALRDGLVAALTARWPELDEGESRWVAELAVRLGVSHLVVPTEATQTTVAHVETVVRRLLTV
ncbi:MAG TPA: TetR family transcriptional regulator [Actinomycetes bacterium]|jgi:AcrR family transcriptional regulator